MRTVGGMLLGIGLCYPRHARPVRDLAQIWPTHFAWELVYLNGVYLLSGTATHLLKQVQAPVRHGRWSILIWEGSDDQTT